MKRSILFSLVVIGAVVGLLAGGATFAPFTADDSDSGAVASGTVGITVLGTGGLSLDFSGGDVDCPNNLAPGDTCGPDTVTITNTGSLSVTLSNPVVAVSGDLTTCDGTGELTASVSAQSYTADVDVLAPSGTATFKISATLAGDAGNDCQYKTGTVTVTVTATNS